MLVQDLLDGDFEEGGRSKVLYLHPYTKMDCLTRQMLLDVLELEQSVRSEYLDHCWLPRLLFDRWLAKHELPASPPRFLPRDMTSSSKPRDAVKKFVALRWPNSVPPNVTKKMIALEFKKSPDGFVVSERTVRRALGGK
jgi:hypothetical protein